MRAVEHSPKQCFSYTLPAAVLVGVSLFAFAMSPVIAAHLSFYGVPPQALIVVLVLVLVCLTNKGFLRRANPFTRIELLLLACMLVSVVSHEVLTSNYIRTSQVLVGISIALVAAALISRPTRWYLTVKIYAAGLALSASAAVLQFSGAAAWLWDYTVYKESMQKIPSGLEGSPVAFAYSMVGATVLILAGCLWAAGAGAGGAARSVSTALISGGAGCFFLFALILTESMSGMLGIGAGLAVFAASAFRGKKSTSVFMLACLAAVFATVLYIHRDSMVTDPGSVYDDNRLGRNFAIFLPLLIERPFGLYDYVGVMENRQIVSSGDKLEAAVRLNHGQAPHNIFVTSALVFGLPAATAQVMLYICIVLRSIRGLRSGRGHLPSHLVFLLSGLLAANAAVFVHMWFHNASLLLGEMRNWFWLGSLAAVATAAARQTYSVASGSSASRA